MRIWHYKLLPYLPDAQFRGQLRELVAIMRDWRDYGKTNHILINRVMDYGKDELSQYFWQYAVEYYRRYNKSLNDYLEEFNLFSLNVKKALRPDHSVYLFKGWHNIEYLRVCMANLYEKYKYGKGKSRLSVEEWGTLLDGYRFITGEEYNV